MSPQGAIPRAPLTAARLEQRIKAHVNEFDLLPIIELLGSLGWSRDEIRLTSHFTTTSQAGLLHDIEFIHSPVRQVRIVMNVGLLGPQSPLPSYFFKKIDSGEIDVHAIVDFLGFFDHVILADYLANIYPETNSHYFPNWEASKRRTLQLFNLKSCAVLHWLFQSVFPELSVSVEKVALSRELRTDSLCLGAMTLGSDAVFGKKNQLPVQGKRITLHAEEELARPGRPWAVEIRARVEQLLAPILAPSGIDVEILLVVRAQRTWAKLHDESHLGYDRVHGGEAAYRRIKLFSGRMTLSPSSDINARSIDP